MNKDADRIVATILGCGSSGGVPRVGRNWGDCDPAEPRNRRRRCSLLITATRSESDQSTQILIDTGADIREQLLDADVHHLDAVFYTHEHADHTHGIDDLRALALSNRKRVDVYHGERTGLRLKESFGYCFSSPADSGYPPILNAHQIAPAQSVTIKGLGGDVHLTPILQEHGNITTLGFRIANFVYSCDVSGFPDASIEQLQDLEMWVLDALRPVPHPSHLSLPEAEQWIDRLKPRQAVLTNLHIDMDYADVGNRTAKHVQPAFDGMQIDVLTGRVLNP